MAIGRKKSSGKKAVHEYAALADFLQNASFGRILREDSWVIPPILDRASRLVMELGVAAGGNCSDPMFAPGVELACGEFLNNIILHALPAGASSPILVHFAEFASDLAVTFVDGGVAWEYVRKEYDFDPAGIFSMAESGRGMLIVEELADEIIRRRIGRFNVTSLRFSPKSPSAE